MSEASDRWWDETGDYELRQLLYWKWDPIGVNTAFPRTADEYDRYVSDVGTALRGGASQAAIVDLLARIERERMGLRGTEPEPLALLATELVVWVETSRESWAIFGPVRR
jgi:hypothetical protein